MIPRSIWASRKRKKKRNPQKLEQPEVAKLHFFKEEVPRGIRTLSGDEEGNEEYLNRVEEVEEEEEEAMEKQTRRESRGWALILASFPSAPGVSVCLSNGREGMGWMIPSVCAEETKANKNNNKKEEEEEEDLVFGP